MAPFAVPKPLSKVDNLGEPISVYLPPHHKLASWGNTALAVAGLGGGVGVLLYGGWVVYLDYYKHGPAILVRSLLPPVAAGILLLVIGFLAVMSLWRYRDYAAALFERGLAISDRKGVFTCAWTDLASLRMDVTQKTFWGLTMGEEQRCLITRVDGERKLLVANLAGGDQLIEQVRQKALPDIYTRATQFLEAGRELDFGPLRIGYSQGVTFQGRTYPWNRVGEPQVRDGYLSLALTDDDGKSKLIRAKTAQIPVLEVVLSILTDCRDNAAGQPS